MSTVDTFARSRFAMSRSAFSLLVVFVETIVIVSASVLCGTFYSTMAHGITGEFVHYVGAGLLVSWGFAIPSMIRDDYRIEAILEGKRHVARLLTIWTYTFLGLAVVGFLTKSSDNFSRGWILLFYFAGFVSVLGTSFILKRMLISWIEAGRISRRKLMVVSVDQDVRMTARELMGRNSCSEVAAIVKLDSQTGRENGEFQPSDLENAVAWARSLNIDDVIVQADWSRSSNIDQIVNAFTVLPAAIHVRAASVVGRFARPQVTHVGETCVLSLKGRPLEPAQAIIKRAFDIAVAGLALTLLAPLFAVIYAAVRLDSRGPGLFLQRRRGYNQRVFQIWKFRTMTAMDDGDTIVQAARNDARVTRVGRFLRRYNFDELPQLINVLRGEMSLVGPRPHAVAHDRLYETSILQYPRRLNMRPGITGWAQVNGLRGQTETDRAMALRLEYDLHYIDNWSLGLDFYIIALTVLSPRAYRNAH
jgi:Undecaprenyl-phosphate glucose phosphotransferase